jgi:hypothetical protein
MQQLVHVHYSELELRAGAAGSAGLAAMCFYDQVADSQVRRALRCCKMSHVRLHLKSGSCAGRKALSVVTCWNSSCCVMAAHWSLCRLYLFSDGDRAAMCERCRASGILHECHSKHFTSKSLCVSSQERPWWQNIRVLVSPRAELLAH